MKEQEILKGALLAAETVGFNKITLTNVAERAKVSPSLVQYHFKTVPYLQYWTMKHAVEEENLRVLAQGLAMEHPVVLAVPAALRDKIVNYLAGKNESENI